MTAFLAALILTIPTPGGIGETVLIEPATVTAPAVRTGNSVQEVETLPPPPVQEDLGFTSDSLNGRCVGAEGLLAVLSPGWDVIRMSKIMWRESRCLPWADNPHSSASGLLQLLSSLHCPWLSRELGPCDLYDPTYNIAAAALLWERSGYSAWSTS